MVKTLGWRFLSALSPAWTRRSSEKLRVLAYHGVPDKRRFRLQMEYLRANYLPIGLDQVMEHLAGGEFPPRACWVTFDDGDPTVLDIALPVLVELSIPATLYVCPALMDTSDPFWWEVVQAGLERGIPMPKEAESDNPVQTLKALPDAVRRTVVNEVRSHLESVTGRPIRRRQLSTDELLAWRSSMRTVGNHSWDHPTLNTCLAEEQIEQIELAHRWLENRVGETVTFAYPNGDATDVAENTLEKLGYKVATLFDHRLAIASSPLSVSRIRTNAADGIEKFGPKVAGLHSALHRMKGGK